MATPSDLFHSFKYVRVREFRKVSLENAKYFGILLCLLAIGIFGHHSHWSFGFANDHKDPSANVSKIEATSDDVVQADGWEISFPSEASLARSGIKTSL